MAACPLGLVTNAKTRLLMKPLLGSCSTPFSAISTLLVVIGWNSIGIGHAQTPAVDAYGGWTANPCSSGPQSHFYTQKTNNRWILCTPAGNAFWMRGIYHVDVSDSVDDRGVSNAAIALQKYGDVSITWGPQQNRRLLSWGFNATNEYSS